MREVSSKKNRITDYIIFGLLAAVMTLLLYRLSYQQSLAALNQTGGYKSDMLAYMKKIMGMDPGYPFPYPVFFLVGRLFCLFTPVEQAVSVAAVLFNLASIVLIKYYLDKELLKENDGLVKRLVVSVATIALFLLSMWWAPEENKYLPLNYNIYVGVFSGNPWHNATYIATRPFAIVTFFSFTGLLKTYEEKADIKDTVIFGLALLLTTMTKPSFTFVFVSAAGLLMAFRLIKSRFSNIKNTLLLALAFVPTFFVLLYQFFGVFEDYPEGAEHGLGFGWFKIWSMYNETIWAGIAYANVFAFACVLFFWREIKEDARYRFTWLLLVVGILEAGLLIEKGYRSMDFNFAWGYIHCIFFMELVSTIKLIKYSFSDSKKWYWLIIGWGAFASQLYYGIAYFARIFGGANYY